MLGGPYRNQLGDRIDPEKIIANLLNFSQLGLYVFLTQMANVQPEMIAVSTLNPKSPKCLSGQCRWDETGLPRDFPEEPLQCRGQ